MNKLNFLNKLRKRQLDRKRKRNFNKIIKIVISHYVDSRLLTFYVGDEHRNLLFGNEYNISEKSFELVLKYLDKLGIKYTKVTIPVFENNVPYRATIKFIYEEE
jgi:hypothetical protein